MKIKNFMKIVTMELDLNGAPFVVFKGKNGVGKSAVFRALDVLFDGAKAMPLQPIRAGASKSEIEVDLGDIVITQKITPRGATLEVRGKDGLKKASPRAVINALFSHVGFNVLEFRDEPPKKQVEILQKIVGLDLSTINAEIAAVFAERTDVNREAKALDVQIQAIPHTAGAPAKEVSIGDLATELERRQFTNQENHRQRTGVGVMRQTGETMRNDVSVLHIALKAAKNALAAKEQELVDFTARLDGLVVEVENLSDENVEDIRNQLATVEGTNAAVRSNQQRATLVEEFNDTTNHANGLTAKLESFNGSKAQQISEAKFPIDGLGFGEDCVLYQELPLKQASKGDSLAVSVAIGMALHPTLHVLRLENASLLDDENMALLAEMARLNDFQILLERVGDEDEVTIIIEEE